MEEKYQTIQNQREHGRLKAISKTNIQRLILWGEKKKKNSVPDTWLFELI